MARMRKEDGGGASYDGEEYEPDGAGIITVPSNAVEALKDHGFELVTGEEKTPAKAKAK